LEPTQSFTINPPESGQPTVITLDLMAAKWTRIETCKYLPPLLCFFSPFLSRVIDAIVTLFVEDNHGSDASSIYSLKLFGGTVHGTNVSGIHQLK
jgi:hypothetical protein